MDCFVVWPSSTVTARGAERREEEGRKGTEGGKEGRRTEGAREGRRGEYLDKLGATGAAAPHGQDEVSIGDRSIFVGDDAERREGGREGGGREKGGCR